MKNLMTFLLCFIAFAISGQGSTDTLFIGGKKYPLQRTKQFHDISQNGPVLLPSEYKNPFENQRLEDCPSFKYKMYLDSTYEYYNHDYGDYISEIGVMMVEKSCDTIKGGTFYLKCLMDTLTINVNDFGTQIPYIKSKNKKIYFCGSQVESVLHDTVTRYTHTYMKNGNIFAYWDNVFALSNAVIEERKSTFFILSNLYYLRENATYYLNRSFVIKLK